MKRYLIALCFLFCLSVMTGRLSYRVGTDDRGSGYDYLSVSSLQSDDFFSSLSTVTGLILTGPDKDIWQRRSDLISHNTDYLYGWLYDLTDKRAMKFIRSHSSKTPISLILENKKYQQYGNDFKKRQDYFSAYQVKLFSDARLGVNFTHAKTFVGDQRWVIQTANLTHSSLNNNKEHFFFSKDVQIRDDLVSLWKLDQQYISMTGKKSPTKHYATWLTSASPNLLVCPLNCRSKIEYLIRHAQESIWISQQYITDESLLDILQSQYDKDIRILTNDISSNQELISRLGSQRVHRIRGYSHDKMMIIDGKVLLIGSMNFSDNALDSNREIGILTTDPVLIQQLQSEF